MKVVPCVGSGVFVGKAQRYSGDCSWELPGSGLDRSLSVYVLDTFEYSNLFTVLWCFDKFLAGGSGVSVIMTLG